MTNQTLNRAAFGHLLLICLLHGTPARAQWGDPNTGALRGDAAGRPIELPLVEMQAELHVTGPLLQAIVTQRFENPLNVAMDAIYTFPLPDRAAVDAMEMHVGARTIVAEVREKEAARAEFQQAKSEGRRASLVEQQRPNLFSTHVANIGPRETISVRLQYREELRASGGACSLVFPMTYVSRYSPRGATVPIERAIDDGTVTAPQVDVAVVIEAGAPLDRVESSSHSLNVTYDPRATTVALEGSRVPADRDLVLSWQVALQENASGSLLIEEREGERYGLLTIFPPDPAADAAAGFPTETLFVVDVSGSMDGPSIEQARAALASALLRLRAGDRFNLLRFNDASAVFRDAFQPFGQAELSEAQAWVSGLRADGGTEIDAALLRGIAMLHASRYSGEQRIVLITDGAVDDEMQLMAQVHQQLGRVRLHVVGIGSAPNRWLMRKLAEFGRGACRFINSIDAVEASMSDFLQRIDRPVWSDIALRWDGDAPLESYPERVPDLYAGEPIVLSLKLDPRGTPPSVTLQGRGPGGVTSVRQVLPQPVESDAGLGARWARAKVESLVGTLSRGGDYDTVKRAVIDLGLRFHLVTAYTSLIAVDKTPGAERLADANAGDGGSVLPQGGTLSALLLYAGLIAACAGLVGVRLSKA